VKAYNGIFRFGAAYMINNVLSQIRSLPLVYIRHIMDANRKLFEKWINEGLAVLHYEGELSEEKKLSTNPEHYSGSGRKVMQRLWNYCRKGAIIVADYDDYGIRKMVLGILPTNSKVEPRVEPYKEYEKGVAYYKIVKLTHPIRFSYGDPRIRPLIVLRPRAGTVVRWRIGNIERYVKYLYKTMLLGVQSIKYHLREYPFTDYQWEVLCSEYLRRGESNKLRIDYLLTPVGRTMKDIDIEGANRSTRIYAQVSLSENPKEIDRKIQLLRSLSHGYEDSSAKKKLVLVYFGPRKCRDYVKSKYKDVYFISTEEVLNKLMNIGIVQDMIPSRLSIN